MSLERTSFDFTVTSTLNDFDLTSDSSLQFTVSFYGEIPESVSTYFVTETDFSFVAPNVTIDIVEANTTLNESLDSNTTNSTIEGLTAE